MLVNTFTSKGLHNDLLLSHEALGLTENVSSLCTLKHIISLIPDIGSFIEAGSFTSILSHLNKIQRILVIINIIILLFFYAIEGIFRCSYYAKLHEALGYTLKYIDNFEIGKNKILESLETKVILRHVEVY